MTGSSFDIMIPRGRMQEDWTKGLRHVLNANKNVE